ncbi:MAG: aldehyde dehydrogenase, partial [Rhodobacterales bacterium 34-62-10]
MIDQTRIDALRHVPVPPQGLCIDGAWQEAEGGTLDVTSPINGARLTTIGAANAADVGRAVAAARRAFEDGRWSRLTPAARKAVLHRIADRIEAEALDLTVLGVRDNGTEIGMALKAEAGSAAGTFRYYAEAIDKVYGQIAPTAPDVLGLVHHVPVGVVAAIVPWNFPLMIGAWKLAPALAAGNSVVLKPAETASLSLLRLAQICLDCGLPDGVLNVVTGHGHVTGEALALSMDVDVMVFTGSGATGRRLLEYAARSNLKRCYLELGGKSPNVVFADAPDLEQAAKVSAMGIFRNAGQVCVAGSRLLVERSVHDAFVDRLARHAAALTVGDPL